MKNKPISLLALVLVMLFAASGCKQWRQMKNMAKCQFRMTTLVDARLAGVDVMRVKKLSDVGLLDAGRVTAAYLAGNLPLNFTLNVEAKNPNPEPAAMNAMAWMAFIDDVQIAQGNLDRRVAVPANGGVTTIPLKVGTNLKEILTNENKNTMANFGMNLVGEGNQPTRVTLKIKPSIQVGGKSLMYPGYISVGKSFN